MEENKEGYSYHHFLFPFIWNGKNVKNRTQFANKLRNEWKADILDINEISKSDELYTQYQYFNTAARMAIFSTEQGKEDGKYCKKDEKQVVWNYKFSFAQKKEFYYIIQKGEFEAKLKINAIRLKLYSPNIGVIVFELENTQNQTEEYINRVNEYGRRVFVPFTSDYGCSVCADKIIISSKNQRETIVECSLYERKVNPLEGSLPFELLFGDSCGSKKFEVVPIIDDRMFVACYYHNTNMIDTMIKYKNGEYGYINSAIDDGPLNETGAANRLYRYVFIDGDGITCLSRNMLVDMLKKHIYERWIEYKTLSGISEYSMVTLTTDKSPAYLLAAFQKEYVEMAILVLAQRAAILNFKNRICECTLGKENIANIHKDYLKFKSQLYLYEVSPQQQGIELYNMMRTNMYIEGQISEIDNQIDELYTQQTATNEKVESTILYFIGALGITGTLQAIYEWSVGEINKSIWIPYSIVIIVLIMLYLIFVIRVIRKRRRR